VGGKKSGRFMREEERNRSKFEEESPEKQILNL
jgi:hypothetical protein